MNEHHNQKLDLGENGYLIATRDDTDDIQDFYLKAFLPDNTLVRQIRILYNIKYDYLRKQIWCLGELIIDELVSGDGYGHLQWENSYGQPIFNSNFVNPYPDNFEPVTQEGCDLFRWEGYSLDFELLENKISATIYLYIYDDLQEWRKPKYSRNKIIDAEIIDDLHFLETCKESELLERKFQTMELSMRLLQDKLYDIRRKLPYFLDNILWILQHTILLLIPLKPSCDLKRVSDQHIKFIEMHSNYIGVIVPYDSRFMD